MASEGSVEQLSICSSSLPKRLVRSVSQKLKNTEKDEGYKQRNARGVFLRCLAIYGRGGGCKVGAEGSDVSNESHNRHRSTSSEEGISYTRLCNPNGPGVDCFSYRGKERPSRTQKTDLKIEGSHNSGVEMPLPDDILEMCLMRLPITSLVSARLVCKKWRYLTSTPRFIQMRRDGLHQTPWLFTFGRDEILILDISIKKWHRISADLLKGRSLFSVATACDKICIIGGRCSLTNTGRPDRISFKTQKGVLVFCPLSKKWYKLASMKHARSAPVVGICEACSDFSLFRSQRSWQERCAYRSRLDGVSDMYEDLHMLSLRRQPRYSLDGNVAALSSIRMFSRQRSDPSSMKKSERFILIVVGGVGSWDERLVSAEIYDSRINKWFEIQPVPSDFGIVFSGVMCNGMFYVYSDRNNLIVYDIEKGYWAGIETTRFPYRVSEYYPKLVSCLGRLFMLCVSWCEGEGEIGRRNKAVRKLWELDLVLLRWDEVCEHPDAPMDWNASFMGAGSSVFGIEVFKIFGQLLGFVTMCDLSSSDVRWNHVSRSHMNLKFDDPCSLVDKSVAVIHF